MKMKKWIAAVAAIAIIIGIVAYVSLTTHRPPGAPPVSSSGPTPEAPKAAPLDEEVVKTVDEIGKRWAQINSLRATVEARMTMPYGPGGTGQGPDMEGSGTYEYQKFGNHGLVRSEVTFRPRSSGDKQAPAPTGSKPSSPAAPLSIEMLCVVDGEYLYNQTFIDTGSSDASTLPPPVVIRGDLETAGPFSSMPGNMGLHPMKQLEQATRVRLLPDAVVNDRPVYVLDGEFPTERDPDGIAQSLQLCFDKETGAILKMEYFRGSDKPYYATTFKNIELNPDLDPSLFVYVPPEGAEVRDMRDLTSPPPPQP